MVDIVRTGTGVIEIYWTRPASNCDVTTWTQQYLNAYALWTYIPVSGTHPNGGIKYNTYFVDSNGAYSPWDFNFSTQLFCVL